MPGKNTTRNHPYAFGGLGGKIQRTAFGRIAAALWCWRAELVFIAALAWAAWYSMTGLIAFGVTLVVALVVPWSRRKLVAGFWCLVTRHRLQRLCWETRMHTRAGRLPLILHIRPTKVGNAPGSCAGPGSAQTTSRPTSGNSAPPARPGTPG